MTTRNDDAPPGSALVRLNAGDRANFAIVHWHLRDTLGDPFLTPETALRLALAVTRRAIETGAFPALQTPPDNRGM